MKKDGVALEVFNRRTDTLQGTVFRTGHASPGNPSAGGPVASAGVQQLITGSIQSLYKMAGSEPIGVYKT